MTTPQDLSGKQLGDYILLHQFASGGMAHIYLGEDTNLKRKAAIKVLTPDMGGADEILKERFEREARAIANLNHPNIVPIYQFKKVDNLYFLAMQFVEGNDLADEVKKYRDRGALMPPKRWLSILKQVAAALDHAHLRGIIHRDVKPSNVLLDDQDRAYLSDFGLVLWEEVDKTLGTAFGTPRYISPEQATDSQQAVPQSDIYSLAVIVYELVTGKVMFKGKTPMEVALSHITEQPTPPRAHNSDIPTNAQNEIMRALQKEAPKRHDTAMEFIQKLEGIYEIHEAAAVTIEGDDDFEAEGTLPIRPEELEEATESSREILDSWDSVPGAMPKGGKSTDPQSKPTQKSKSKEKTGGGLPIRLIAGAIIVLGIAFAAFMMIGGGAGGGNVNVLIHYNADFFAITNISDNERLLLDDIKITGRSGEPEGTNYRSVLEPGDCVFVIRSGAVASDIPDEWNCSGNSRATVNNSSGIYWRADVEQDTAFNVSEGNSQVVACDTWGQVVGRTGNLECRVAWPNVESAPSE